MPGPTAPSPVVVESGVDLTRSDLKREFAPHTEVSFHGGVYCYMIASERCLLGEHVSLDPATGPDYVKPVGTDQLWGIAQAEIELNEWGWIGTRGKIRSPGAIGGFEVIAGAGGGGVSAPPSLRSLVDTALHPGYPADGELLTWVDADKKWEGVPFDDSRFIWANLPTETLPDVGMTVGSLRSLTQGVSYQFPTVHVDPHGADLGFDRAKVEHIGILDQHVQDAYLYKLTDEQYIVQMRDHKASLGHRIYPKLYTLDLSPDWPNGTGLTATGPVGFRNSDQEALDIIGHRSLFGGLTIAQKVNEIEGQLAGHNNKAQTPTDGVVELGIGPQPTIGLLEDNNAGTNFWDGKEYLVSFSYKAGESAATIHDNFSLWIEVGTEYKRFIDRNDGAVIRPMVIKHFIDAGTLVKIEYNPAEGRLELVEVEHQVSSTAVTFLKSDGSTPFQPVDSALAPNLSLSVNPADQLIYKTGTGVVLPILTIASGLGELAKVTLTNPADKEVLTYDATADGGNGAWVNKAPAAGAGGATTLDSLTDVSIDAPNLASDQVLKYDPTANSGAGGWVNAAGGAASFDYLSHSPQVPVALPTTPVGTNAIIKLGKPTEVTDHHLLTNSFTDAVGGPGNNWLEVKHWEQSAAMHCVWLSAWETGVDLFGTGTAMPPSPKVLVIGPSLPTQPIPNIGGLAAVFTGDIILDGTHSVRATNWNFDGVNARFVGATVDLTNAQIDFSNAHLSELKINLLDDVVIDYGTMAAGHALTAFNNGGTWGFRNEPVLASINDLTDVDTHTQPPKDHEVLTWIAGIGWHPHSLASHPVTPGAGVKQLDDLDDVNIGSPTAGEILVYDDTLGMWMNQIPGVPEPPAPAPPAPTGGGGGGLVHTMSGATGVVRGTPRTQLAGEVGVNGYSDMGASISYTGAYVAGGNTPTPLHHTQYLEVEIWLSDTLVSDVHPDDHGTIRDFYFFADKHPLFIGQPDLIEVSLRDANKQVARTKDDKHLLGWGPDLMGDEADPGKWLITHLVDEARSQLFHTILAPQKRIDWIFDAQEAVIGMKMIRPVEFEHPEWGIDWQVKWQVLTLRGPVSEGAPA